MRTKKYRPIAMGAFDSKRERDVQEEIDNFLRALSSYPDRFAREPHLSFEQHLFRISGAGQPLGVDEIARRDRLG